MGKEKNELGAKEIDLGYLHSRDYLGINGKFHAHVSIRTDNFEDLNSLRELCKNYLGTKITIIDLYDFKGNSQKDCMFTKYYNISHETAVDLIIDDLNGFAKDLINSGYAVMRIKLEHEGMPTLPNFNKENYREVHVKMQIPKEEYDEKMKVLKESSTRFGYVPSRNPSAREEDVVHQFINLRYYEGTLGSVDAKVASLSDFLKNNGIEVEEIKKETTVFDTNHDLDKWWA